MEILQINLCFVHTYASIRATYVTNLPIIFTDNFYIKFKLYLAIYLHRLINMACRGTDNIVFHLQPIGRRCNEETEWRSEPVCTLASPAYSITGSLIYAIAGRSRRLHSC